MYFFQLVYKAHWVTGERCSIHSLLC